VKPMSQLAFFGVGVRPNNRESGMIGEPIINLSIINNSGPKQDSNDQEYLVSSKGTHWCDAPIWGMLDMEKPRRVQTTEYRK
jgi:hypothetical protein